MAFEDLLSVPNQPAEIETKTAKVTVRQEFEETAALHWWTTKDGVEHPVRVWRATPQRAVVLYFHGIESHGRWFEDTAIELNKSGITTYAFDRRGAGLSKALRGHADSWQQLVDDADELLMRVRAEIGTAPIFCVANCWGAKVAVALAGRKHNSDIRGIAMTSPAVSTAADVTFMDKVKIGFSLLAGGKHYFDVPLEPENFTDVPEYLNYIRHDPYRLTRVTASFFFQSINLTRACKIAASRMNTPILVLQSGRDTIVNVDEVTQWFNSLRISDKKMVMFDHMAHSLDFEPDAKLYQDALSNWILERADVAVADR